MQAEIDTEALTFIITNAKGPYMRQDGRYWHKADHVGPDTCAGCALEQALEAATKVEEE